MKKIYEKPKLNIITVEEKDDITLSSWATTLTRFASATFDNCIDY